MASSRFMQDARFSDPPDRFGRLGQPVGVYPPDLPVWLCHVLPSRNPFCCHSLSCFILLSPPCPFLPSILSSPALGAARNTHC
eukprot:2789940-Pyramimonas_sp.AAC.1